MRNRVGMVAAAFGVVLFSGCAETVGVQVMRPAEINLKGIKKIAVGDIAGPSGPDVANELTTALVSSQRYDVVDRQNLERILAEQRLSASDLGNPDTAPKVGKLLGASALIVGTVSRSDFREQPVKVERIDKNLDGSSRPPVFHYTRTGVANVSATLRVTDLTTGKVVASRTLSESADGKTESEAPVTTDPSTAQPDALDGATFLAQARGAVIERFMKAIAPFYEHLNLPFQTTSDLPDLDTGVAAVRKNDWPRGAESFAAAVGKSTSLPPKKQSYAHFDLGMALCFGMGDFQKGLAEIRSASQLHEDSDYASVEGMCQQREKDAAKLLAQGVGEPASPQ